MTFSSPDPIATKKPLRRWNCGGHFCQMRTFMRHWLAPAAILGSAILLSACAYYPNGPYGPGYGPPPPPPPPHGAYGPPPGPDYGPPPGGGDEAGPPPSGDEGYGPSGGAQSGPPAGGQDYGPGPKPHGPRWCAKHPKRCAKQQQMMQQGYGPPPSDESGPPPNDESGPPPNDDNGPPPGGSNDEPPPPPPQR
jgi:hypothetical protein